uniref:Epoxide hydrolase domain-like phosphatase n=1 Tax=Rhabditophanes sp. KR3021 TaxID=114890 RepID=A0AC35UB96_9BILA
MVSEGKVKCCIFDMGGVIMMYSNPQIVQNFQVMGGGRVAEQVAQMDIGALTVEEFVETAPPDSIENKLMAGAKDRPFEELLGGMHRDENFKKCLSVLRENGIKTALLTNNFFYDKLKTRSTIMADLSQFDVVVESCKVGLRKPDPAIYNLTLERLALKGEDCLFVDDLKVNCSGAEAVGIKSVHVNCGDTEAAVKEIGQLVGLDIM